MYWSTTWAGIWFFAQFIGRTALAFYCKNIDPAAKNIGTDLFDFAAPEIARFVSGRKNFKTAAKIVGRQPLRKLLTGSRKGTASRTIPTEFAKQISQSRRNIFYKHFSLIIPSNFRYQPFGAVSGNLGGKVPVVDDDLTSHEQEIYSITSPDENCIEFDFQKDRNYYAVLRQTYLALKMKFVKGCDYETYITKDLKKGAQIRD